MSVAGWMSSVYFIPSLSWHIIKYYFRVLKLLYVVCVISVLLVFENCIATTGTYRDYHRYRMVCTVLLKTIHIFRCKWRCWLGASLQTRDLYGLVTCERHILLCFVITVTTTHIIKDENITTTSTTVTAVLLFLLIYIYVIIVYILKNTAVLYIHTLYFIRFHISWFFTVMKRKYSQDPYSLY